MQRDEEPAEDGHQLELTVTITGDDSELWEALTELLERRKGSDKH